LLSPEHAHSPLPLFPDPDHVLDVIAASIRDRVEAAPAAKPAKPSPYKSMGEGDYRYTVAPPRGIGGDQMPSGYALTRDGPDYFASKPAPISVTPPSSVVLEPQGRRAAMKAPAASKHRADVVIQRSPKYAVAPLPPGVEYPDDSLSSRETTTPSSSSGTIFTETTARARPMSPVRPLSPVKDDLPRDRGKSNIDRNHSVFRSVVGLPTYMRG
jgi:hypothetical protein